MSNNQTNYTREEHAKAKMKNILTYLKESGYELVKDTDCYRSKLHKSLVIKENGLWYWNSKEVGGRSPIELLQRILVEDYGFDNKQAIVQAVKRLSGVSNDDFRGNNNKINPKILKNKPINKFMLPPKDTYNVKIIDYLCSKRGLDSEIVTSLIKENKIYQTKDYYNVVFVGFDKDKNPKNATIRGIHDDIKKFHKQVEFSDKSYPFVINGHENANTVCCFETPINAISHATFYKINDRDYKNFHRISLTGLSFGALNRFLQENPKVTRIISCLKNDKVGNKRNIRTIFDYTIKGYDVISHNPNGVDFNADLMEYLSQISEQTEGQEL